MISFLIIIYRYKFRYIQLASQLFKKTQTTIDRKTNKYILSERYPTVECSKEQSINQFKVERYVIEKEPPKKCFQDESTKIIKNYETVNRLFS